MNRKALDKIVDEIVDKTASRHGVDLTGRAGIDPRRLLIQGKVFESLLKNADVIVNGTNPPAVQPPIEKAPAPAPKPAKPATPVAKAPATSPADALEDDAEAA